MTLKVDSRWVASQGGGCLEVAQAIVEQCPSAVLMDISRISIEYVQWLRAHPCARFPIVAYWYKPDETIVGPYREWLSSPTSPDRLCDSSQREPESCVTEIAPAPDYRRWQRGAIQDLIQLYEPRFRHDFKNRVAAVRLLLGAIRCGILDIEKGRALLAEMAEGLNISSKENVNTLLGWWAEAIAATPEEAGKRLAPLERNVLLLDDQADSAGWTKVLGPIFGTGFAAATNFKEARELLGSRVFDLALIDIELTPPENGIDFIRQLRASYFDLPVIAFSVLDRSEVAMAALRAGADAYFAKEMADKDDRESLDYFNRFHRVVSALPRAASAARTAWRGFETIEAKLKEWEDARRQPGDNIPSCIDFFRMGYFFATAPRADAVGDTLVDVRHRIVFGTPQLAATQCLHHALRLFAKIDRDIRKPKLRHKPWALEDALREMKKTYGLDEHVYESLTPLRKKKLRHKLDSVLPGVLLDALPGIVELFRSVVGPPGAIAHRSFEPQPLFAGDDYPDKTHQWLRGVGFQTLGQGIHAVTAVETICPLVVVDDNSEHWRPVLQRFWGHVPTYLNPLRDPVEQIVESGPANQVIVMDLDWGGDRGQRALALLEKLKTQRPWQPVLVASAMRDSVTLQRALYRGASAFFVLGPANDPVEYAAKLRSMLSRAARLAGPDFCMAELWGEMREVQRKLQHTHPKQVNVCMDTLRLAIFCWWPDYNPAETWRYRALAGVNGGLASNMLLRMFAWLSFRAQEALWLTEQKGNKEYGMAYTFRNQALHVGTLDARPAGDYVEHLRRVLRLMRQASAESEKVRP